MTNTNCNSKTTSERVREVLDYDPLTGEFTWKVSLSSTGRAGKPAGCKVAADGYQRIRLDNTLYLAHRLAWLHTHGAWPKDQLDHVNRVRHDNRLENLREATNVQNSYNKPRRVGNKSGIPGVYWTKVNRKWQAQITHYGRRIHLGYFVTMEEAAEVRRQAEITYHGVHPAA